MQDSIEVIGDSGKVFGLYADGNLLMRDEPAALECARDRLLESAALINSWLEQKNGVVPNPRCISSKEPHPLVQMP